MSFALLFPLILQGIAALPSMIAGVEALFSKSGTGAQKKAAVQQMVAVGLATATSVAKVKELTPEVQAQIVGAVGTLTDSVVSLANAAGVFEKGGASVGS